MNGERLLLAEIINHKSEMRNRKGFMLMGIYDSRFSISKNMDKEQMKKRTKEFALQIILVANKLPKGTLSFTIKKQLIRSGTSVAANYRAVCRARSDADFINKLGVVIEEADETAFWLELIVESKLLSRELVDPALREADEITAMMVTSRNTASDRVEKFIKGNQKS